MRPHFLRNALVAGGMALSPIVAHASLITGSLKQTFSTTVATSPASFDVKGFDSVNTGLINPVLTGVHFTYTTDAEVSGQVALIPGVPQPSNSVTFDVSGTLTENYGTGVFSGTPTKTITVTFPSGVTQKTYTADLSTNGSATISFLLPYATDWTWTASAGSFGTSSPLGASVSLPSPTLTQLTSDLTVKYDYTATAPATTVPEPPTTALLGLGLVGLGFSRRRARRLGDSGTDA